MMTKQLQPSASYVTLLKEIKERVHSAQVCAAFAVNGELILLYWQVGRDISSRFDGEGWGTKVIDRLAKGIGAEFSGVEGFSVWNLRYRRSFAEAWPEPEILQQLIAKLPWGHSLRVLDWIKDRPTRECYLKAVLENGRGQNVLVHHISTHLHERWSEFSLTGRATRIV